ncbi:hypothetical protein [Pseudomonas fluorescens]|uniref:hypothetical protein n=1 Tax=Pseudomonas fluorescens TaxID=294 RepID=UPI00147462BD|nr:hypothetical protein [Pseudomonas fluorescens]NNB67686.1 hypothetical protein [Pseudomonas fluorescens]
MSFGLSFTNSSDVVTLDSEYSRLVILYYARFGEGGVMGAVFKAPITSQEPPLIFAKPDGNGVFQWVRLLGGPGNWTGFLNESPTTVGTYFLAVYESAPTATFGLRLWDGNSKLLFDNGTPCAQITRFITSWSLVSYVNPSPGRWIYTWNTDAPLSAGEYMLINNIAYDIPCNDTYGKLSCSWSYQTNKVSAQVQNIGDLNPNSFFLSLIFAKPIA